MKSIIQAVLLLAASVVAQVYENPNFNAHYEAPAGWVVPKPDTTKEGNIVLKPNRVGLNPSYLQIFFFLHNTAAEAYQYPGSNGFFQTNKFMNIYSRTLSTQAPIVYNIQDTTEPNVHYCYILVKQVDQGIIMAYFATSNRFWSQSYQVITTIADWNANENNYMANWYNMRFISETGPVAKISASAARAVNPDFRRELYNLLGRRVTPRTP